MENDTKSILTNNEPLNLHRWRFYSRNQLNGESVADYYRALTELSHPCHFTDFDQVLKDKLIHGLLDDSLRHELIFSNCQTLDRVLDVCRSWSTPRSQRDPTFKLFQNQNSYNQVNLTANTTVNVNVMSLTLDGLVHLLHRLVLSRTKQ